MKQQLIYKLTEEDVQHVSEETLGRKLTSTEKKQIKDTIAEKINWFEAIEDAINECVRQTNRT